MPEQLTKHPDVTLQVLKSAGAKCGEGAPQEILKSCPTERFCKLPGGEVCVYGLPEATRMTQIAPADLVAAAGSAMRAPSAQPAPSTPAADAGAWPWLIAGLIVGALLTFILTRRRGN